MSRRTRIALVAAVAALSLAVAVAPAMAGKTGPNNTNAKQCQKGGWESLTTDTGGSFANEQACVSYAAQGGALVNPLALCKEALTAATGQPAPATANYILGTPGDDFFDSRTAGVDVYCGFGGNDLVGFFLGLGDFFLGGEGADRAIVDGGTFYGGGGGDRGSDVFGGTFNGGDGDDTVGDLFGGVFNGGPGSDEIQIRMEDGTFNGGDGDDLVLFMYGGIFNGGPGNDRVVAMSGGVFNQD